MAKLDDSKTIGGEINPLPKDAPERLAKLDKSKKRKEAIALESTEWSIASLLLELDNPNLSAGQYNKIWKSYLKYRPDIMKELVNDSLMMDKVPPKPMALAEDTPFHCL